jgi:DNA-binding CsgD family transcriptional regulator
MQSQTSELIMAVQHVAAGHTHMPSGVARARTRTTGRDGHQIALTSRQGEVLELIVDGRSGKQIASLLGVSPKTVEFHVSRIKRDLNVSSHVQLIRLGLDPSAKRTGYSHSHGLALMRCGEGKPPNERWRVPEPRFKTDDLIGATKGDPCLTASGSKEIPVWGDLFSVPGSEEENLRIRSIVQHAQSLQVRKE